MPNPINTPRLLAALALCGTALAAPAAAQQPAGSASDSAEVRAVLETYFRGQATGDGSHMRTIFQPSASLYWIREGKYSERPSTEWIASYTGKPAADEAERRRRIASIDITGNAAAAKLVSDYPTAVVTDYMSLLRTESGWKVVAKTFVVQPRAR